MKKYILHKVTVEKETERRDKFLSQLLYTNALGPGKTHLPQGDFFKPENIQY